MAVHCGHQIGRAAGSRSPRQGRRRGRAFGESQDRVLVAVPPCFRNAAGTAPGDCWAIAGDRDRGGALRPAPAIGTIEASPIRS